MADVAMPMMARMAPLDKNCTASLVVEYSCILRLSIVTTLLVLTE